MTDADIVALYWARDEQAIAQTAQKFGAYCRKIAMNLLGSQEDAEECENDTWMAAWNSMPQNRPDKLAPYLGRITRNLALDLRERQNAKKRGGGQTETVLEELLQNALVHIDLLKTAAIRLMVFDDRVEIVNPGCVMGGHTIDEVKMGNSFARNPLMANFCAKTMPYRGLGSGIPRVLAEDSRVEFIDSKEGNQFTVRISRPLTATETGSNTDLEVSRDEKAVSNSEKAASKQRVAVSKQGMAASKEQMLLAFCVEPKPLSEICKHLGLKDRYKVKKKYIDPLLNKSLRMTEPESPNSPTQKYVTI